MPQWDAEHTVDADLARSLIAGQFPDLGLATVTLFGAGWDNIAYLVNGEWVFRFPRRQIAVPLLEQETRALPAIAPRLPLAVPVPQWLGKPSEAYPWPFVGYRLLPGRTACHAAMDEEQKAALAEPLAHFLKALHALPVAELADLHLPGDELGRLDLATRLPKARAILDDLVGIGLIFDPGPLQTILTEAERQPLVQPRPPAALVHGDLYCLHLLVDESGQPSGAIDWGDVHLGDKALDLGFIRGFLPATAQVLFLRAYGGVDAETWRLARYRALMHSLSVAAYAADKGEGDLLREALTTLERLAVH